MKFLGNTIQPSTDGDLFVSVLCQELYLTHKVDKFLCFRIWGFPGGSDGKESACNVGDPGLIPGSGGSPGEVNSNPLQYSFLEDPMVIHV